MYVIYFVTEIAEIAEEYFKKAPPMFVFWLGPIASFIMKDPKHIEVITIVY